jgi:hypothetical protein
LGEEGFGECAVRDEAVHDPIVHGDADRRGLPRIKSFVDRTTSRASSALPRDPHIRMYGRHDDKPGVWHGGPDEGRPATGELYDLVADPDEPVNPWDDPAHLAVRATLDQELCDVQMNRENFRHTRVAPW